MRHLRLIRQRACWNASLIRRWWWRAGRRTRPQSLLRQTIRRRTFGHTLRTNGRLINRPHRLNRRIATQLEELWLEPQDRRDGVIAIAIGAESNLHGHVFLYPFQQQLRAWRGQGYYVTRETQGKKQERGARSQHRRNYDGYYPIPRLQASSQGKRNGGTREQTWEAA